MTPARTWARLLFAQWRESRARIAVTVLALALGTAMASAIHLVNRSALDEFEQAARRLAGEADLAVRGSPPGFPEALFAEVARLDGVAIASPVLELTVDGLTVVGLDPFRAAGVQPALFGEFAGNLRDFFEPDGIFLSAAAAGQRQLRTGDRMDVLAGTTTRQLRVLGLLDANAYPRPLGVMDIAAAQWQFDRLGLLTRIDVRLREGASTATVRAAIEALLPAGVVVVTPAIDSQRVASATRAYRTNLGMLALVAVLTGAFLVLTAQALSVLRRRSSLALLRALGVTRRELGRLLVAEGVVVGAIGAAIGVGLGQAIAYWTLRALAGDLGAGQLAAPGGTLAVKPLTWLIFIVTGALVAGLAAWLPAREAAARPPALALKSGDVDAGPAAARPVRVAFALIAAGAGLAFMPSVYGLPLFGYASIAALLFGGVLLVPSVAQGLLRAAPATRAAPLSLAVAQLRGAPAQASLGLAAIIVSFSLMVAMAIMVHSFRESFIDWLDTVLPADMQLRLQQGGNTAALGEREQAVIARQDGVSRAEFRRVVPLLLRPEAAPVTLIAADIDAHTAAQRLAILHAAPLPAGGETAPPVWVSEAMTDLYGVQAGAPLALPLAGREAVFRVAGVYREYGRSGGAVVIPRATYVAATGDRAVNEASLWLARGADPAAVARDLRAALALRDALQLRTTTEVRERSLANFDRAFIVTYALEAIAVLIGLLGVGVTAAATAFARRAEFGMLRHVGLLRRELVLMLAGEGLLMSAIGVVFALALGGVLSLVLVYVVNRQSFLWSIDLAIPWLQLALLALALICAAAITTVVSGRAALGGDAVRAVREDW